MTKARKKFTSISDRYQNDPMFVTAANEEMQKYFGRDRTLEDAYAMDELANGGKTLASKRWYDNQLPAEEMQTRFTKVPEVRSAQAGGSNTQRVRGPTLKGKRSML